MDIGSPRTGLIAAFVFPISRILLRHPVTGHFGVSVQRFEGLLRWKSLRRSGRRLKQEQSLRRRRDRVLERETTAARMRRQAGIGGALAPGFEPATRRRVKVDIGF